MNKKKSQKKSKKQTSKSKNKRFVFILPVIIIICLIVIVIFTLTASAEAKAQLVIEYGTVQIKHEGGSWVSAENGMNLFQSDSIRTGDNSSASIILFESSIIRLDSNTEVTIQEIIEEDETSVKLRQDEGRTWNTIRKMSGIDNYEVQTPTTIASVQGTSYDINMLPDGNTTIGVENGTVNVTIIINGVIIGSIEVNENESITVHPSDLNQSIIINPFKRDGWILINQDKDILYIDDVKSDLYSRIEEYIPELKATYGITDEEIDALIEGYLLGYYDIPDDAPNWIVELIKLS